MPALTSHKVLLAAGDSFGYGWPTALAKELKVHPRTITRWMRQTSPMPTEDAPVYNFQQKRIEPTHLFKAITKVIESRQQKLAAVQLMLEKFNP